MFKQASSVSADNVAAVINQSSPVLTPVNAPGLLDIELPVSPDFDWLSVLQTSVYWFLGLLILAGLVSVYLMMKTRHKAFSQQPLWLHVFMLRKQLAQLEQSIDVVSRDSGELKNSAVAFYAFSQRLVYVGGLFNEANSEALEEIKNHAILLAFSNQPVSRETMISQLKTSRKQLNLHGSLKELVGYYWQKMAQKSAQLRAFSKTNLPTTNSSKTSPSKTNTKDRK